MQKVIHHTNEIRSTFMVKPAPDGKFLELIENFEITNDFKDHVIVPYLKQKYRVGLLSL